VNSRTGCTFWSIDAGGPVRNAIAVGALPGGKHGAYFGDQNAILHALDAETGREMWKLRLDDYPGARIVGSVTVHNGVVYAPVTSGDEVDAGPLPTELADEAVDVAPATASQVVSLGVSRGQFLGEARETGRFEHGRLVEPRIRKEGELVPVSWGEALAAAAAGIAAAKESGGPGAVALIGGARLTNESAYAWAKLVWDPVR